MIAKIIPMRTQPNGEARLFDVVRAANARGQVLVTNGTDIYLTPRPMRGEFRVGVRVAGVVRSAGAEVRA
jgi:hypothetical protein